MTGSRSVSHFLFPGFQDESCIGRFPFFFPFISLCATTHSRPAPKKKKKKARKKMPNPANPFSSRLFPPGTKITWPTGLHTNSLCQKLRGENLISDLGNIDRRKSLTSWLTPSRLSSRSSLPLRTRFFHLVCANVHLPSGPWSYTPVSRLQSIVGAPVAAFRPFVRTRGPGSGKCWAAIKNCPERLSSHLALCWTRSLGPVPSAHARSAAREFVTDDVFAFRTVDRRAQ